MYKLIEGTIIIEGKKVKSYGISFNDNIFLEDVSTEKSAVQKLVELFNSEGVEPKFAPEIIEDFLS